MVFETFNEEQTKNIGYALGKKARPGNIYCLKGDLGTGKTVFTKGFAEGLGITEHITSPTFTIVNEYKDGRIPLYHFDVYRIGGCDEMYDIGYEEYIDGDGVCLIEWAELIEDIIPKNAVWIVIEKDMTKEDICYRKIEVK